MLSCYSSFFFSLPFETNRTKTNTTSVCSEFPLISQLIKKKELLTENITSSISILKPPYENKWILKSSKKEQYNYLLIKEISIYEHLHSHPKFLTKKETYNPFLEYQVLSSSSSLLLERCLNVDLFHILYSTGPFSLSSSFLLFQEIINSIELLHECKVVHLDLRLDQFLLDSNFNFKVIDFGWSQIVDSSSVVVPINLFSECMFWVPELTSVAGLEKEEQEKEKEILINGYAVDIWHLGMILFILLFGFPPFSYQKNNIKECKYYQLWNSGTELDHNTFWNHMNLFWRRKYPFESSLSPIEQNSELQDLLEKMLDPLPENRPTIKEIKHHPWMKQKEKGSKSSFLKEELKYRISKTKRMY